MKMKLTNNKRWIIAGGVVVLLIISVISYKTDNRQGTYYAEEAAVPSASSMVTPIVEPAKAPTAAVIAEPTASPTAAPTPVPTEIPTLMQGMKDDNVAAMQSRLIELGYLSGEADGEFGKATLQAVKDFQVCNGLNEDGVAGQQTLTALFRYDAVKQKTVYVSSSGVYHLKSDCSGMKRYTEMKLSDAIRKGYRGHNCK